MAGAYLVPSLEMQVTASENLLKIPVMKVKAGNHEFMMKILGRRHSSKETAVQPPAACTGV